MPHPQDILDIFAKLAALGVTPEQAAAGIAALAPQSRSFQVGDRVRIARRVEATPYWWLVRMDVLVGREGTVSEELGEFRRVHVDGESSESRGGWVYSIKALDLLPTEG